MSFTYGNLEDLLKVIFTEIGLDKYLVRCPETGISIIKQLDNNSMYCSIALPDYSEFVRARSWTDALDEMFKDLRNSPQIQSIEKEHLAETIALRNQIEELKKYKTYYDMHKELKHNIQKGTD